MKPRAKRRLADAERARQRDHVAGLRSASPAVRRAARRRFLVLEDHRVPRGMVRVTVVPLPFSDSSSTVPPCASMNWRVSGRPRPERRFAAHARFRHAVEAVEHARQILGGDARTIVADADHGLLLVAVGARARSGPCGRCRRSRCCSTCSIDSRRRRASPNTSPAAARSRRRASALFSAARGLAVSTAARHRPAMSTRSLLQRDAARIAGGQVEHVVDQLRQALDRFQDRADIIRRALGVSSPA